MKENVLQIDITNCKDDVIDAAQNDEDLHIPYMLYLMNEDTPFDDNVQSSRVSTLKLSSMRCEYIADNWFDEDV